MSNYVTDTMNFNDSLKLGTVGIARWTANFNYYDARAEVIKVNKSSIKVRLIEPSWNNIYTVGNEIILPRCAFHCIHRWSANNGFFREEAARLSSP